MESKSPFHQKSPLNVYIPPTTGAYSNPKSVIQPLVWPGIADSVGDAAGKAADKIQEIITKNKAKKGTEKGSTPSNGSFTKAGANNFMDKLGKNPTVSLNAAEQNQKQLEGINLSNKDKDNGYKVVVAGGSSGDTGGGIIKQRKTQIQKNRLSNQNTALSMKGSPNKFTGSMASTAGALQPAQGQDINPYGDLNPGAGTGLQRSQAEESLAPVLASPRPMDQAAMSDPYSSPGATVDPKQAMNAETIFGQKGQRQALMNLGTPLYDKGHASDYDGHTHRKKGGSYKEGDYMDETDMETSYPKLYTQDVGEISKDKKSQFMVSKNEDYNPTKIDTIRQLKGKTFKMSWGDAERNISTNPNFKNINK